MPGIGQLNSKHCSVFQELLKIAAVRIQLYISRDSLVHVLQVTQSSGSREQTFPLHANIYGPSSSSQRISTLLSNSGLCLQDPIWLESEVVCQNPHVVSLEELTDIDVWLQELSLRTVGTGKVVTSAEWNAALDSLPQHSLSSNVKDSGVLEGRLAPNTELLPYALTCGRVALA